MVKKLSRGQKAWATRRANQLRASKEIATKIGIIKNKRKKVSKIGQTLKIRLPSDFKITDGPKLYTPAPILTLCGQLEDAIMLLEVRISNSIAKINSLM